MSETLAREKLGRDQAELMRALAGRGPVPGGFDRGGVEQEARTLALKRRRTALKSRPALARALGRRFDALFADFAAERDGTESPCADAAAFEEWFHERLAREGVAERINWRVGLAAVIEAAAGRALSLDARADLAQFQRLVAEVARRRGPDALEAPPLKASLVIASLAAFGVELDRRRARALRAELVDALANEVNERPDPATMLEATLAVLATNLAVDRVLARVLTPEERERYLASVGDDAFLGKGPPRVKVEGTRAAVAASIVNLWRRAFGIDESATGALEAIAAEWVANVAHVEVAAIVPGREQAIARAAFRLEAQRRAESALEALEVLGEDARARIERASGSVLFEVRLVGAPVAA